MLDIYKLRQLIYIVIKLGVFQHHHCMEIYIKKLIYTIIFIFQYYINI